MMVFQRPVKVMLALIFFYSQNLIAADPYPLIDPPLCFNLLGETVECITRSASQGQVAAGVANRDSDGRPIIVRMNYDKADPRFSVLWTFTNAPITKLGMSINRIHHGIASIT